MSAPLPETIETTLDLLSDGKYVGDRSLATALFLALKLGRPLFLEGEAGVGKTEIESSFKYSWTPLDTATML